jgi:hypothetical protein
MESTEFGGEGNRTPFKRQKMKEFWSYSGGDGCTAM